MHNSVLQFREDVIMQTKKTRAGQQFGNYRLTRRIGKGGYAEVYLAEHVVLNNNLRAIKVMTGTNLPDYQREGFLTEARTISNLQHPHIVQIYDVDIQAIKDEDGEIIEIPYLIMEYAAEGTLRDLYPHEKIVPLAEIVFYVNQIAEALQYAHDQSPPIVHRDVKPENMLLRSRDHVLLSDFGIAATGQTGPLAMPTKIVAGTATYIAPERFSHHLRRASDQYSLAIVVYEWLCGYCPFDGTSEEICYKQISAQPPPLYPRVTLEIENAVMRALAKNPDDRYPTVQEFARALEKAIQSALFQQQQQQRQAEVNASQFAQIQQQQQNRQAAVNPGEQGKLPQPQQNLRQGIDPQNNNASTTVPRIREQASPLSIPLPVADKSVEQPSKKRQNSKLFSFELPQDGRDTVFVICGLMLNVLSAVFIGLLLLFQLRNISVALSAGLGAFVVILLLFALCVGAIEKKTCALFWYADRALLGGDRLGNCELDWSFTKSQ